MAGIYNADGKICVTISPGGSVWRGVYAPDGSWYITVAPGNAYVGAIAPDGSLYVTDATGSTTVGLRAPDGSLRMTSNYENNGALQTNGTLSAPAFKYDFTSNVGLGVPSFLSHSRAGNAMMVDASGKLTYAPNNLLTYSNTFSNVAWAKVTTTLTPNAAGTAPDGIAASSMISLVGSGSFISQTLSWVAGQNGLVAVYAKSSAVGGAPSVYVTVNNNTAWNTGPSAKWSLTNSWQLIYVAGTISSGSSLKAIIGNVKADGTPDATAVGNVDIAFASLSSVTYETTPRSQDQVVTGAAAYYGPRVESNGLLIEEARTNLFLNSSSPATQTITVVSGQTYTVSFYGTGSITLTGAAAQTMTGSGVFPNRTTYTFVASSTSLTCTVGGTITYPQVELGSFPTSYIPTAAAAVTRAADSLSAASYSSNPVIIEYTPISTGVTARKVINPSSGISSEQNERITVAAIYPLSSPAATLNRIATQVGGLWT